MPKSICLEADCDRPAVGQGLCNMHYKRAARRGTISIRPPRGICTLDDCTSPHYGHGFCERHWIRWSKHGDPLMVKPKVRFGERNTAYVGASAGYSTIHSRLRKWRGLASQFACCDCGKQAQDWSYDHKDPAERVDPRGLLYTVNLDHYIPRCVSCHVKFDNAWARKTINIGA